MTLVDWILDTVRAELPSILDESGETTWDDLPIERVNRDDSEVLDGDIRKRKEQLERTNFVGATHVSRPATPLGADLDERAEDVVEVRFEGMHADQYGHVDGDDEFDTYVDGIRESLRLHSASPDAPGDIDYVKLYVEDETRQSALFRDYFLAEFDVRFVGHRGPP